MAHRKIELARGTWGVLALTAPRFVLHRSGGNPSDRASRVVMRILGARQATQAALSGIGPTADVLALGVWVDFVHALTAIGLAAADRKYLRPAAADAAIATGWALAGLHDLSNNPRPGGEELRTKLARTVLAALPGGNLLLVKAGRNPAACR